MGPSILVAEWPVRFELGVQRHKRIARNPDVPLGTDVDGFLQSRLAAECIHYTKNGLVMCWRTNSLLTTLQRVTKNMYNAILEHMLF